MENFEEYNDILYIERKKCIETFLISLIAFLVVKFSLKNINDLGEDIISIIFLIESSYILLIVKFTSIASGTDIKIQIISLSTPPDQRLL